RGMTAMREAMRDAPDISARVVLGGKLSGYVGRYPGVLEEALLDLRSGRPLFLVGAFGGAARLVCEALRGQTREELTTAWVAGENENGQPRNPFYIQVKQINIDNGIEMKTPEELGAEFAVMGENGVSAALRNGLNDSENDELVVVTDPRRIVELITTGLRRLYSIAP
ncbi:MAG: hypothetical protein V1778_00370, partial [bacterium]